MVVVGGIKPKLIDSGSSVKPGFLGFILRSKPVGRQRLIFPMKEHLRKVGNFRRGLGSETEHEHHLEWNENAVVSITAWVPRDPFLTFNKSNQNQLKTKSIKYKKLTCKQLHWCTTASRWQRFPCFQMSCAQLVSPRQETFAFCTTHLFGFTAADYKRTAKGRIQIFFFLVKEESLFFFIG